MTNGDKIRQMSNEDMADFFYQEKYCPPDQGYNCNKKASCVECWLEYLEYEECP